MPNCYEKRGKRSYLRDQGSEKRRQASFVGIVKWREVEERAGETQVKKEQDREWEDRRFKHIVKVSMRLSEQFKGNCEEPDRIRYSGEEF